MNYLITLNIFIRMYIKSTSLIKDYMLEKQTVIIFIFYQQQRF